MTANYTYKIHGVIVNSKIIPDTLKWKDATKAKSAGFSKGDKYKKCALICGNGKPLYITIHNTQGHDSTKDDAELYTRATYNENMGSARVHFYVGDLCIWQTLKAGLGYTPDDAKDSCEVGWHAGDGSDKNGGNYTSIGIEIMGGYSDQKRNENALNNAIVLIREIMRIHGISIDKVVSHTYWVNRLQGKKFKDVNEQCTNIIYGKKWCPVFIFKSNNKTVAYKNWCAFKDIIKNENDGIDIGDVVNTKGALLYTNANAKSGNIIAVGDAIVTLITSGKHPYHIKMLDGSGMGFVDADGIKIAVNDFRVGDCVKLKKDITTYVNGKNIPNWVRSMKLYIRDIVEDKALTSIYPEKKEYTGRFYLTDLERW